MRFHHLLSHHVLSPAGLLHLLGHEHHHQPPQPDQQQQQPPQQAQHQKSQKKQSSLQTIFCVWNTMLGSTLLTMPWGFAHAGILPGTALTVFLYIVALYTCLIIVNRGHKESTADFSLLCRTFLGEWAHRLYQGSSILLLLGAAIAYHNFITSSLASLLELQQRVPLWIPALGSAVILFTLSLRKDPKALVKVNSLGILSVWLTMFFVIYEGSPSGQAAQIMRASSPDSSSSSSVKIELLPSPFDMTSVASLSGILGMSFFIHNAILSIMANNANHDNDSRDVVIAFTLALVCYLAVGLVPNLFVEEQYLKMHQNFLVAFPSDNYLAIAARSALVCQLTSVYPLVLYFIRAEVFGAVLRKPEAYPGRTVLAVTNVFIVTLTAVLAVAVPQVGTILSWSGAVMGFVLLYLLPPLVEYAALTHPHVYVAQLASLPTPAHTLTHHHVTRVLLLLCVVCVGLGVVALQVAQALVP